MSMWQQSKQYEADVKASGQTLLDAALDLWTKVCEVPEDPTIEHHTDRYWSRHNSNASTEEVLALCESSVFAPDFAWLRERVGDRDHAGRGKVLAAQMINYLATVSDKTGSVLSRMLGAETTIYLIYEGVFDASTRSDDEGRRAHLATLRRERAEKRAAAS